MSEMQPPLQWRERGKEGKIERGRRVPCSQESLPISRSERGKSESKVKGLRECAGEVY